MDAFPPPLPSPSPLLALILNASRGDVVGGNARLVLDTTRPRWSQRAARASWSSAPSATRPHGEGARCVRVCWCMFEAPHAKTIRGHACKHSGRAIRGRAEMENTDGIVVAPSVVALRPRPVHTAASGVRRECAPVEPEEFVEAGKLDYCRLAFVFRWCSP